MQRFVRGRLETPAGGVPLVDSKWTGRDRLGTLKARWGIGRMRYTVVPGLYALGAPDRTSPVLVTANFKMSFDRLRRAVGGSTPGSWSWTPRGSTSGARRARAPSAPTSCIGARGRAAGRSRRASQADPAAAGGTRRQRPPGARAESAGAWSTVRCAREDLPAFLDAGMRATPEMRRMRFPLPRSVGPRARRAGAGRPSFCCAAALVICPASRTVGSQPSGPVRERG